VGYDRSSGPSLLDIRNGGTVTCTYGYVDDYATADVDGAGSGWTSTGVLYLDGDMNVTGGGTVACEDGYIDDGGGRTAIVTVDGTGSTWTNTNTLTVGYDTSNGSVVLDVVNGGTVTCATGYVNSMGAANIDGVGSNLTSSGHLYLASVPSSGATMTITNGGTVNSTDGYVSYVYNGLGGVTVDGADSTWTNTGELHVAYRDEAEMDITNGGAVTNTNGSIGYHASAIGRVDVDGAGSSWANSGDLAVGRLSNGSLYILSGATVSSANAQMGYGASSSGIVTVDGNSSWINSGDLTLTGQGASLLTISGGSLVVASGLDTLSGQVNVRFGGELALAGDADGSLAEFLGLIGGTDAIYVWDGSASAWTHISGAVHGVDYSLTYYNTGDLAGYTVLNAGGTVVPDGDLDGDGDADADDVDLIVANIGGDPGTYDMDGDGDVDVDDMIFFVETYLQYDTDGDGTPDGVGTYRGDFNTDGVVNATDLLLMKIHYGSVAGFAGGNANADTVVNATDLQILQDHFGQTAAPVPEPITVALLTAGGLAVLRRRRS